MEQSSFVRKLVRRISEDMPCGQDLKDTELFFNLFERFKLIKQTIYDQALKQEIRLGHDDVSLCMSDLEKSFRKTKDLKIASWLLYLLCITKGISGLKDGLILIDYLINNLWKDVYPKDSISRIHIFDWINSHMSVEVSSTMLFVGDIRVCRLISINSESRFDLVRDVYKLDSEIKRIDLEIEECLQVCNELEKNFKKNVGENITLNELKSSIRGLKELTSSIGKLCIAIEAHEEAKEIISEDESYNHKQNVNSVQNLVLREKTYDELNEIAGRLLRINKRDIIALVLKDTISKLRNKEVADILQFLIEDTIYLKYIQRLINETKN